MFREEWHGAGFRKNDNAAPVHTGSVWASDGNGAAELYARNVRADGDIEAADVFGPSMAVRAAVIADGDLFDETIGPEGTAGTARQDRAARGVPPARASQRNGIG